ncbi:MAG: isocitrate dehydrogenase (NAD+), partial [Bradymonadia bacterium]
MHNVVLIEGDGIGPEIAGAVQRIVDACGVEINWIPAKAGLAALEETGSALPKATLDALQEHCLALKGPTTTPVGGGHRSVNVQLRKALGLFANVRNVRSLPGVKTRYENIDIVIVRENVEDTYGGIEYMQTPDVALGFKFITRAGSESVVRYAFEHAKAHGRKKVTCVHKANIHKMSDGLFLEVFREVALEYPGIESDDLIVDNTCMQLVSRPERFDVAVMPNLYGDIVSDLCAGLIGGLGVAPGSNIGDKIAVFEAVHGSAPDIAGQGIAN